MGFGKISNTGNIEPPIPFSSQSEATDYAQTTLEVAGLLATEIICSPLLERAGVNNYSDGIQMGSKLHTLGALTMPYPEEFIFRFVPYVALGKGWDVGIGSSIIFALMHNIRPNKMGVEIDTRSLPVSQFVGGMYLWHKMGEPGDNAKGFDQALYAHVLRNAGGIVFNRIMDRIEENSENPQ